MTDRKRLMLDAEEFVSGVLSRHFGQKIEAEALRHAAEKVAAGVRVQGESAASRARELEKEVA